MKRSTHTRGLPTGNNLKALYEASRGVHDVLLPINPTVTRRLRTIGLIKYVKYPDVKGYVLTEKGKDSLADLLPSSLINHGE